MNQDEIMQSVVDQIEKNERVMLIMRGLPGSGKSTFAREVATEALRSGLIKGVGIFSTDDYFMEDGEYLFDGAKIAEAHKWNKRRVSTACDAHVDLVVVDNTNTTAWEMSDYEDYANDSQYDIIHVTMGEEELQSDNLDTYIDQCDMRNTHNVPREVIAKMARRFEL